MIISSPLIFCLSLLFSHPYPKVEFARRVSLSYTTTNKKTQWVPPCIQSLMHKLLMA